MRGSVFKTQSTALHEFKARIKEVIRDALQRVMADFNKSLQERSTAGGRHLLHSVSKK
jgi:hypothetical protein